MTWPTWPGYPPDLAVFAWSEPALVAGFFMPGIGPILSKRLIAWSKPARPPGGRAWPLVLADRRLDRGPRIGPQAGRSLVRDPGPGGPDPGPGGRVCVCVDLVPGVCDLVPRITNTGRDNPLID